VKPANMGSSVGVSRATSADEFDKACERAFRYDGKVLVERSVAGAREIECSVLEDAAGEIRASPLGEIVPAGSHGFYSYDANQSRYEREGEDPETSNFKYVFGEFNQLGINATLQARF